MAEDRRSGTNVAIKKIVNVISDEADTVTTMRVLREIKLLRHFHHDNVRDKHTQCSLRWTTAPELCVGGGRWCGRAWRHIAMAPADTPREWCGWCRVCC